jgi:hypothetical protein
MKDKSSALISKIDEWLLNKPTIFEIGPAFHGGTAGWLSENGEPSFAYPEIGGYFLSYLSAVIDLNSHHSEQAKSCMLATLDWLINITTIDSPPRGRYPLPGSIHDWRAKTVFVFDLGIILRGLESCRHIGIDRQEIHMATWLYGSFLDSMFITRDALVPCKVMSGCSADIPFTWSTQISGHLLKALSFSTSPKIRLPSNLIENAQYWGTKIALTNAWEKTDLTHPLLYFVEGLLIFGDYKKDPRLFHKAAKILKSLCEVFNQLGFLPEKLSLPNITKRADVQAQFLRAILIADCLNLQTGITKAMIAKLEKLLRSFIQQDGSVVFLREGETSAIIKNTWCAMFTVQALRYLQSYRKGELHKNWAKLLI